MRGLKQLKPAKGKKKPLVASFTDAWIETIRFYWFRVRASVASFTDAWIETCTTPTNHDWKYVSHLLQMRGLKLRVRASIVNGKVASFTDAWIETKSTLNALPSSSSHLLQMRGLKHPFEHGYKQNQYVASFTDAWIETHT